MKVIVTGGAGFIGSCIVRMLNDYGIKDIIIVDNIASTDKWKNLRNKQYTDYVHKGVFLHHLGHLGKEVSHIIHMGACSSTTEENFDYLYANNLEYTKSIWSFCVKNNIRFIYASSAATYGMGENGFNDFESIDNLIPLNGYGYSKQLFDLWAAKQEAVPPQVVGLKFFNVFGPNEYYKNSMASVVLHGFKSIKQTGKIELFKSYKSEYEDGEQKRDFVYIKDVCKVIEFFIEHPSIGGLFNVGTGHARSFNDLAKAVFNALEIKPNIGYKDMPENIKEKYQYFTQAKIDKLIKVGYNDGFMSLEDAVGDYVRNYLNKDFLDY